METVVRGGVVVDPSQLYHGNCDILIREGKIVELAEGIATRGRLVIECEGRTVIPGLIDVHTHLREPGGQEKETIRTGSRAAAAGGYTSITALPNTQPVCDNQQKVQQLWQRIKEDSLVRIWPLGAITKHSAGQELTDIAQMVQAGIRAVTDDGRGVQQAELARRALQECAKLKIPYCEHCEEESIAGSGQIHPGKVAKQLQLPGIPVSSETLMMVRDAMLAKECKAHLHIMHVSCAETVDWLRLLKTAGVVVTAEVTPHHLLLSEEAVLKYGTLAKMKPPLRTEADRQALITALVDGTIDLIATDHAPHTTSDKERGFSLAPFGIIGLETAFPLLYTHLVRTELLTLSGLVERMSCRPAALLDIPHGTLKPGFAADLTIIDLEQQQVIDKELFYSQSRNTPFHGWLVYGLPVLTMVEGKVVMHHGEIKIN
ncbi:MAG TPA: dihydroorotase [Oscillospiraceae bacterium]|nr:dihydroorotase [Oscillospiraceae bacterium]